MNKSRSTTGCARCKRKRRKCDEGKPRCQRCESSGNPCNYEYVEPPNAMTYLIRRTKPAPRAESIKISQDSSSSSAQVTTSLSIPEASSEPTTFINFDTPTTDANSVGLDSNLLHFGCTADPLALFDAPPLSDSLLGQINLPYFARSSIQSVGGISGGTSTATQIPSPVPGPERPAEFGNDETQTAEDRDPEGVQALLCVTPTIDRNVKENSLPFVLQCYSQWAIFCIFEPRRIVHAMREQVIKQFSSEDSRTKTILMANVMNAYAKNLSVDGTGISILTYLASKVQEDIRVFMTTPPASVSKLDRQRAMRVLDNTFEIMTLQLLTQSLAAWIQSVEDAAPVFRRACSEPPGQPLNLVNILLEPGFNLRHFVSADIMGSLLTGRPTCFKYEVAYSAELCERIFQLQENHGLQWLHGNPDQFIMIFAWINSLSEIPEAGADSKLVSWVETEILQVKTVVDQSASEDPALRIGRMVVRECWRNAALIYLYMVLCGAGAHDSRVVRALSNFMRLVRGIKPRHNPDTFLANAMVIAGLAARKERP